MDAYSYAYEKEEHLCTEPIVSLIQIDASLYHRKFEFQIILLFVKSMRKIHDMFCIESNYDILFDMICYIEIKLVEFIENNHFLEMKIIKTIEYYN